MDMVKEGFTVKILEDEYSSGKRNLCIATTASVHSNITNVGVAMTIEELKIARDVICNFVNEYERRCEDEEV